MQPRNSLNTARAESLSFSPDNRLLGCFHRDRNFFIEVKTAKPVDYLGGGHDFASWSPDGRVVIASEASTIAAFDANSTRSATGSGSSNKSRAQSHLTGSSDKQFRRQNCTAGAAKWSDLSLKWARSSFLPVSDLTHECREQLVVRQVCSLARWQVPCRSDGYYPARMEYHNGEDLPCRGCYGIPLGILTCRDVPNLAAGQRPSNTPSTKLS